MDLRAFGCNFVIAPIATRDGNAFVQLRNYSVALYPFIEGRSFSFEESFGKADWGQVLGAVVALHRVPITAIRPPEREGFVVPWLDQLDPSMRHGSAGWSDGPHSAIASRLLIDNEAAIARLIARYRSLVVRYSSDPAPVVVTHGEIHPGNVMRTSNGWVIVDWDTVLLAPPERDLWRFSEGGDSVLRAYGEAIGRAPAERLLDLYRMRWDLAEIASFAAVFRAPHEDTEDSRKSLEILCSVIGRLRP